MCNMFVIDAWDLAFPCLVLYLLLSVVRDVKAIASWFLCPAAKPKRGTTGDVKTFGVSTSSTLAKPNDKAPSVHELQEVYMIPGPKNKVRHVGFVFLTASNNYIYIYIYIYMYITRSNPARCI